MDEDSRQSIIRGQVIIFWWKSESTGYNYIACMSMVIGWPINLAHIISVNPSDNHEYIVNIPHQ